MKKLLTLSLCLLATLSLANCSGGKKDPSSSVPSSDTPSSDVSSDTSSSESKPLFTYKEVGTKTETSLTVLFYVNLPNDNSLYRTHYVEPGEKIKQFSCIVTGYRGSLWFYDQFGTDPFDFDTPITEDLVLYGYPQSRKEAPAVTEIPVKEGEYAITWDTSKNCSFVPADAGALPTSADKDEVVSFKMAYAYNTKQDAVITVNGTEITPDENGVYSVTVTEDIVIASSDVKVYANGDLYDYTLHIGSNSYEMTLNPSNSNEVMYEGVQLNVGDTFYVEKTDGKVTETYNKRFTGNPLNPVDTYVCSEAGKYSFYFDTSAKATWIAGPIATYTFTDLPDEYVDCKIFAWNWLAGADGSWAQGTVNKDAKTVTFNFDANTEGVIILAYAADNTSAPGWEGYLVRNDSDFLLTKGTTSYSLNNVWSSGGSTGGSTGGSATVNPNAPTTGYALVINGTSYVPLTHNPSYSGDGEEWYALGVTIEAGDVITMYNGDAGEGWVIKTPDSWSAGSWTGTESGIVCNQSGTYDVYCKMIYQNDNIYFGAA